MLHCEEMIQLFNEEFTTSDELSLSDFSDIRFKAGEDVSECYQKKMNIGRTLGLDNKLLLESLTSSLTRELKQLVINNSPKSTTEWRELVHKRNK